MKAKIIHWILTHLAKVIMRAIGGQFDSQSATLAARLKTELHYARDHLAKENSRQWQMINAKLAAIQALDVPLGRDAGKIVILARVSGQDVVKFVDIRPDMPMSEFKELVRELEGRYGAPPTFIDAPPGYRDHLAMELGLPPGEANRRAAQRDRRFMQ